MPHTHRKFLRFAVVLIGVSGLISAHTADRPMRFVTPSTDWKHPHHAYVAVDDASRSWSVQEVPLQDGSGTIQVLGGPLTRFCQVNGLAISAKGNLYVSGLMGIAPKCGPAIEIFAPGAHGNVPPVAKIQGSRTDLHGPFGMTFDGSGNLYVAQARGGPPFTGAILVFAAGARGNVAPIASISGSKTGFAFDEPLAVCVDGQGYIYVGQDDPSLGNQVLKFPPGANGNVRPIAVAQLASSHGGFGEMQLMGSTLYAPVGILRQDGPRVYELRTSDLMQTGAIVNNHFLFLHADVDSEGTVYVQDFTRYGTENRGRIFVFEAGHDKQSQVIQDGFSHSSNGGYIVVGP